MTGAAQVRRRRVRARALGRSASSDVPIGRCRIEATGPATLQAKGSFWTQGSFRRGERAGVADRRAVVAWLRRGAGWLRPRQLLFRRAALDDRLRGGLTLSPIG